MEVKFDYEYEGRGRFGPIYRPVAKVSLESPYVQNRWITFWMVVDTGADFTILPKFLSRDLKISLKDNCWVDKTRGVGGEESIYFFKGKVSAKVDSLSRQIPIAFLDSDEVPPLMGRLGFLETFNAEFLKTHQLVLGE